MKSLFHIFKNTILKLSISSQKKLCIQVQWMRNITDGIFYINCSFFMWNARKNFWNAWKYWNLIASVLSLENSFIALNIIKISEVAINNITITIQMRFSGRKILTLFHSFILHLWELRTDVVMRYAVKEFNTFILNIMQFLSVLRCFKQYIFVMYNIFF